MFRVILLAVLIVFGTASPLRADSEFSAVIPDMPVASGLYELHGEAVVFDAPGGRYAETRFRGQADVAKIREYYRDVLPSLGWQPAGRSSDDLVFVREDERLEIRVGRAYGRTQVELAVQPR